MKGDIFLSHDFGALIRLLLRERPYVVHANTLTALFLATIAS